MPDDVDHAISVCGLTSAATDANFDDLHKPLNSIKAIAAAEHCIYCYDAPCITACPTSIDIPTFIHQIRSGNVDGAARTILSENIMGGTCARACPTEVLCEQACVRNHGGEEPVEIGLLQRFATDHLMAANGPHPFSRAETSGKTVAVIGAGPAGLSCAHRLAMLGHDIVVFEAREKAGGLNEYGLAAYKMVDDFAQREVEFLLEIGGIEIKYGQALGHDIELADLQTNFDAVFIGVGLGSTNRLGLDKENVAGIKDAIDFIEELRQAEDKSTVAVGHDVIVIGGGNTAIDAAVQSKKLGAENVTLTYRRGEEAMSATRYEIDLARRAGVIIRLWSKPQSINGADRLESMTFERTRMMNGKLAGTGETFDVPSDMVLKAIGQQLDLSALKGFEIASGKVAVPAEYATNIKGVFAGGDCVHSGEDLTVQAVEDGKQAAHAIDMYLKGKTDG